MARLVYHVPGRGQDASESEMRAEAKPGSWRLVSMTGTCLPDAFALKSYPGILGTGLILGALAGWAAQKWGTELPAV